MEPRILAHQVTGEGSPLVLVPGALTGWLSWIPHEDRLRDHHQVIRVQPIHNERGSAGIPGDPGYSAAVERESLLLTLDHLDVDSADFAGWSGGARALIEFGIVHPRRARTLTLVEPPAYWVLSELGESDPSVEELERFLAKLAGREVTPEHLARFLVGAGFAPDPDAVRSHPAWESWVPHRMALSWQGFIGAGRQLADLACISSPSLLVKGTRTVPWQARVVDRLGDHLPRSKVVELEGDHACHIESMDRFLEEMEEHLH
ncbi:MAG: alpha/beta fold hydrolase [Actinomycetota bacterium]